MFKTILIFHGRLKSSRSFKQKHPIGGGSIMLHIVLFI
jgi:hypothetical protein